MADPSLRLDPTSVSVQPGGQAQVSVTVTSESAIVEGYELTVLGGQPSRWAEVVPSTVNVYPGEEATATVVFSPPTGTEAVSGRFPFGVKATSTESDDASSVAEGTVELGAVSGLQMKMVPVTSRGRWKGRHVIRLDNWGNAPARLRLVPSDKDAVLGFYLKPDVVELPVGASTSVRLTARGRRPFLRGNPETHAFQVVGEPLDRPPGPAPATPYADPSRPVVDGGLLQKPILSRAVVALATLLVLGVVAAGVWAWHRPQGAPGSLGKLGTPPTPKDFQVASSDARSIKLRWKPVDQIDSYALLRVEPEDRQSVMGETSVNASQNVYTVTDLEPDTTACFKLLAIRAGLRGPATAPVCGRTTTAPASPSATPTASQSGSATGSPGQQATTPNGPSSPAPGTDTSNGEPSPSLSGSAAPLGGGKWVLVTTAADQDSPAGRESVDGVTAKLKKAGLPTAQTIDSTQFPKLQVGDGTKPLWLSVVGPYDTQQAALLDCTKVDKVTGTFCRAVQPDPS